MKCIVCGNEVKRLNKGMCYKHYKQYKQYGYITDSTPSNMNHKHKVIEHDNYNVIQIVNKDSILNVMIDKEDKNKIIKSKWCKCGDTNYNYIFNATINKYLEDYIMCNDNRKVNRIIFLNGNDLDMRKDNLKIVSYKEYLNKFNYKNNSSDIRGVSFDKSKNKWKAYISVDTRFISLGTYTDKNDAINARLDAENKYFG